MLVCDINFKLTPKPHHSAAVAILSNSQKAVFTPITAILETSTPFAHLHVFFSYVQDFLLSQIKTPSGKITRCRNRRRHRRRHWRRLRRRTSVNRRIRHGLTTRATADPRLLQILQPSAGVEFGVHSIDPATAQTLSLGRGDRFHRDESYNRFDICDISRVGGFPPDNHRVAGVPEVELVEVDLGLLGLTGFEGGAVAEGGCQEGQGHGGGALRAGVYERVDGFGVVDEVWGEELVGEGVGVVRDEEAVVCGDFLG